MQSPYHCTLDIFDAPKHLMNDKQYINNYIKFCVKHLNLTPIGEPTFYQFEGNDDCNGITASQLLGESLFSLHTYGQSGSVYCDLFSCRPFDQNLFYTISQKFFHTENIYMQMVKRQSILD